MSEQPVHYVELSCFYKYNGNGSGYMRKVMVGRVDGQGEDMVSLRGVYFHGGVDINYFEFQLFLFLVLHGELRRAG